MITFNKHIVSKTLTAGLAGALFMAICTSTSAAIVYTFTDATVTPTLSPTSDDISAYNAGNMTVDAALFGATGFSTGSNSTGAYPDASGVHNWFASSMNAQTTVNANTPYLAFTLTPESGESVVVQSFFFGVRALGSNDPTEKATATTGWPAPTQYALRSSLDSYASNVASGTFPSNKDAAWYGYSNSISIAGAVDQAVTLRLYLLDAGTGDRGGAFRIDDVTISAVPEPGTIALYLGFITLGLVLVKRRLRD